MRLMDVVASPTLFEHFSWFFMRNRMIFLGLLVAAVVVVSVLLIRKNRPK